MTHSLEVIEPGAANTVQDGGRLGWRHIGVPASGASDPLLLACANHLLGNAPDDAAIEMPLAGPSLRATDAPVRVALAGVVDARLVRADGSVQLLSSCCTSTLRRGDTLRVGPMRVGVAYLAMSGGAQVPRQLGSRSTYVRARLGGIHGRPLAAGDELAAGAPRGDPWVEWHAAAPFEHEHGAIRVMLGPQDDAFEPAALHTLLNTPYRVGCESDRMGMRLEGERLRHKAGADITSDGVVPGAIQVPGDGAAIVLLADAQTVGGYAKIATVIRADLPRLAHARPGSELRFEAVSRAQAIDARQRQAQALARWTATIRPYRPPGVLDLGALSEQNLVSGMIDAGCDTMPWEHPA